MLAMSKVPRGCFSVREQNGDLVIFDPKAQLTPGCRVLVYLRHDLRVRFLATFSDEFFHEGTAMIRVRVDHRDARSAWLEFDRAVVEVAVVVNVDGEDAPNGGVATGR